MKKILLSGALIAGLIMMNPINVLACDKGSGCVKCAIKEQQCIVTKLKKELKMLWAHKELLAISEKQLDQIKSIKHKALKELIQLHADKEIIMVDLKSAMWAPKMDLGAVNKIVDKKYDAKKKAAKVFVKAISDVQGVLTDEQNKQWHEMKAKAKLGGSDCAKCAYKSGAKICPITGKVLSTKGSAKGSM